MTDRDERAAAEARVKACYSTWASTYHQDYYAGAGAYPPVHQEIVRDLVRAAGARTLLDAGCGPASMLRSLTGLGVDLYGFDLTPQMVAEARAVMAERGVPSAHVWEGSVADADAFHGFGAAPRAFDAAICIGVLPHVPEAVEQSAITNLRDCLAPGGVVAIEARNQLFGLFTLNRYSYELFARELIDADALRRDPRVDPAAVDAALEALRERFRMDLPPVRGGTQGEPGYDEVLSRTHNPFVLKARVEAAGFSDVRVLFYHYHRVPPMLEPHLAGAFRDLSVALEDPADWRGHFMASAFIVSGEEAVIRDDGWGAYNIWEHSASVRELYARRCRLESDEMTCHAQAAALLAPHVAAGDTLLDAGCGSGYFYHSLRKRAMPVEYHGIDASRCLIEIGQAHLPGHALPAERLRTIRIEDLDGSVDHAVCINVLSNIDNYHRPLERLLHMARKSVILRESCAETASYTYVKDEYLDPGVDLGVHVNTYPTREVVQFMASRGFQVEVVRDDRAQDQAELVIGHPHYWTFLVAIRTQ